MIAGGVLKWQVLPALFADDFREGHVASTVGLIIAATFLVSMALVLWFI